jgi:hypothetical protein
MHNSAYPKHYTVAAISPALTFDPDRSVQKPMLFLQGGQPDELYWTDRKHWRDKDLKKIVPAHEKYLSFLPPEHRLGINEGDNVYFMHPAFHDFITGLIQEGAISFSLSAWHPSIDGYYASVMTKAAFDAFRAGLTYEIWPLIEDFIVASVAKRNDVFELFNTYSHLITQDEHAKQIHALRAGAFYRVYGDENRFKVYAWQVVNRHSVFPSEDEYVSVLDRYINSLRSLRLTT